MEQAASSSPKPKKGNMTNQKLLEGMDSVEAFDKMYMVRKLEKIALQSLTSITLVGFKCTCHQEL